MNASNQRHLETDTSKMLENSEFEYFTFRKFEFVSNLVFSISNFRAFSDRL